MPTVEPLATFSFTALAAPFASAGLVTSNSSTSSTLIVKTVSAVEPSALVARTVMVWLDAASRSSRLPSATVTTPVALLMANRPPASSVSE